MVRFFHFLLLKAVLLFTFVRRESVYLKTKTKEKQLTRLVFYYENKKSNQGYELVKISGMYVESVFPSGNNLEPTTVWG